MPHDFVIFSGTSNPKLSEAIAKALGSPLGRCTVERFPDTEVSIELHDPVRGRDVFVVQSTSPPVDEHLMELLAFGDVCRRCSAHRVISIVPYFGYARSDKRLGRREPIAASMIAGLMRSVGIDHVLTVDVHTAQIEGFFHIPFDNLTAIGAICDAVRGTLPENTVVVSPDAGRVPMATKYADLLDLPLVVLHKRRMSGSTTAVTHVVGAVEGRHPLLIDDMITTGSTMAASLTALQERGAAAEASVATTHAIFVGDSLDRLRAAGVRRIVATDSVPHDFSSDAGIEVVSIAPLLAAAIVQITTDGEMGSAAI